MKHFRSLVALTLCLCLLMTCTGNAFAVEISRKTCVLHKMSHCTVTGFKDNRYAEGRPLIIFFLGSQECFSWLNSLTFIRDQKIFGELDADLLFVTLPKAELWYRLWEAADREVCDFLMEKLAGAQFPIIVDAVSFGGYGGCFLTGLLRENGITVQELNLADACNSNCVYADTVRDIALGGTKVNIFGSTASNNISKNTRTVIEELEGTENVTTMVFQCRHAKVLNKAITELGLHGDLPRETKEQ